MIVNCMESLTKKNFWDEMSQKYPNAMKLFLEWVDEYKKVNNFLKLFNGGIDYTNYFKDESLQKHYTEDTTAIPKLHELPVAMQFGIFLEWSYPFIWLYHSEGVVEGYRYAAEKSIHNILRWKEYRLKDIPIDRIEPI